MKQFRKMTYPYVIWISIMIVVPMLLILLYAFTKDGNEVTDFVFTFANFKRFLSDAIFLEVLWRSLKIAVATTVICILLQLLANLALTRGVFTQLLVSLR